MRWLSITCKLFYLDLSVTIEFFKRLFPGFLRRTFLASILFLAAACSPGGDSADGVREGVIVAKVDGRGISAGELRKSLEKLKRKYRVDIHESMSSDSHIWLKTDALNSLIQNTLFRQEAGKRGVSLSAEEIEDGLIRAKDGYLDGSFKKYLEIENISLEDWEKNLKNNLLIKKLIDKMVNSNISVDDEGLNEYFAEHEREFHKGKQVKVLHIMVETEEEALNLKKQLDSNAKEFSDLAREFSLGPEGAEGGDLGYLEEGQMPAELEEIFKLNVNEISNIIRTPYGSHLFKVVDKRKDRKMSFDESRKIIRDKLLRERRDKAFKDWLAELKENAKIEIKYDVLSKIS